MKHFDFPLTRSIEHNRNDYYLNNANENVISLDSESQLGIHFADLASGNVYSNENDRISGIRTLTNGPSFDILDPDVRWTAGESETHGNRLHRMKKNCQNDWSIKNVPVHHRSRAHVTEKLIEWKYVSSSSTPKCASHAIIHKYLIWKKRQWRSLPWFRSNWFHSWCGRKRTAIPMITIWIIQMRLVSILWGFLCVRVPRVHSTPAASDWHYRVWATDEYLISWFIYCKRRRFHTEPKNATIPNSSVGSGLTADGWKWKIYSSSSSSANEISNFKETQKLRDREERLAFYAQLGPQ